MAAAPRDAGEEERPQAVRAPQPSAQAVDALAELTLRSDEVSRHAVRLIVVDADPDDGRGGVSAPRLTSFSALPRLLRAGDLLVVNDAATLPASLHGRTATGAELELRLSGPPDDRILRGVLLGAGDHRTRTEDRPPPPELALGEPLFLGPRTSDAPCTATATVTVTVTARRGRLVELRLEDGAGPGSSALRDRWGNELGADLLWQALYRHGAPVQYAHRPEPSPLWSVQTAYAARPWAAEMPSAGRPLTWGILLELRRAGVALAALTHAAGLSATGDPTLDAALPWPERYELPTATAAAVAATRARGRRIIAAGTTVVRALEASRGLAGTGVATLRLDASTTPRITDGVISGLHLPGESHFELLTAFAPRRQLVRAIALAAEHRLSRHEFGDACLVLRASI